MPRIVTGVVAAFAVSGDGEGIAVQGWPLDQHQRRAQPSSTCDMREADATTRAPGASSGVVPSLSLSSQVSQ